MPITEEQKARYRANRNALRATLEGKAARRAYNQTEKAKATAKAYKQSEKSKAKQKEYAKSAAFKAVQKKYKSSPKGVANKKAYSAQDVASGKARDRDCYYRKVLHQSMPWASDIPQELIEIKRAHLKLNRLIKELKK
jgi:hypothetical protein